MGIERLNESFDMIMIDFAADAAAVVYIQTNLRWMKVF